jgi:hypothetical protein
MLLSSPLAAAARASASGHRASLALLIRPIQLVRGFTMITAGIRFDDSCIHRKTFALGDNVPRSPAGLWEGNVSRISAFPRSISSLACDPCICELVGELAEHHWTIGFANQTFHVTPRETFPIDVTFDDKDQTADPK